MSELKHLSAEELQTFVEGGVPEGDRVVIESHLVACLRCQSEAEEWRTLFTALSGMAQFEPSAGFADRVLVGLHSSHATSVVPWYSRVTAAVVRVAPKTTRGWALAAAFLALPLVSAGLFLSWLLSKPYVTPHTLWAFTVDRSSHALQSLGSGTITWAMKTDVVAYSVKLAAQLVHQVGMSGVGALAAAVAFATTVSIWVLYNNLFRSPSRETSYVSYSF
jgi:anti-sigma factor RsiW